MILALESRPSAKWLDFDAGHLEVVQLLVLRGASVSLLCEGSPPLVVAVCSSAHPKRRDRATACVKILLDGGASPYQR